MAYRDLTFRVLNRKTNAERAADIIFHLAADAGSYDNPSGLWAVYPPGDQGRAVMTPEHRCASAQACFHAEQAAFDAAQASGNLAEEYQWQRQELARMILGWERWHEDREAWRMRLEEEWIPKVLAVAKGLPFDVPAYVERMRRELAPWNQLPITSAGHGRGR